MTEKELYDKLGADYEDVLHRLMRVELVRRFVLKFADDENSFKEIVRTMEAGNYEEAFKAVHTFKGVVLNLSLTNLSEPVCELTELLRNGEGESSHDLYERVKSEYMRTIDIINNEFRI